MRILLPILLAAAVSACAQTPIQPTVQTPEQKRQMIMEHRDEVAISMNGIRLDNRWPAGRAENLEGHLLLDLGKYYAAGKHIPNNFELAEKFFTAAFEKDSYYGGKIGYFYYNRMKDYPKAIHWYEKSIRAGDPVSLAWISLVFLDKTPGFYDPEKFVALSRIAVAKGVGYAHNYLGDHYSKGKGVEKNYVKALQHYIAAFEYDPITARPEKIGAMYLRGQGVDKNPAEAVKWYRRAVQGGDYRLALWLAERYRDGTFGKDQHLSHAFSWYLVSAILGDSGGLEMARDLFPHLQMDTIKRAIRLAQNVFDGSDHYIYKVNFPNYWLDKEGIVR